MFDYTIEVHYTCNTNINWEKKVQGSKGKEYIVRWDEFSHKNHDVNYDFSCTCESYKFSKTGKYCKHIEAVKHNHCGWDGFMTGDKAATDSNGNACCPKCGGPVTGIKHGV